jgi:hypothetical protein
MPQWDFVAAIYVWNYLALNVTFFFVMICLEYLESVKHVHLLALFGFMTMRLHGGGLL